MSRVYRWVLLEDDGNDARSVATLVLHELERVDEVDEEHFEYADEHREDEQQRDDDLPLERPGAPEPTHTDSGCSRDMSTRNRLLSSRAHWSRRSRRRRGCPHRYCWSGRLRRTAEPAADARRDVRELAGRRCCDNVCRDGVVASYVFDGRVLPIDDPDAQLSRTGDSMPVNYDSESVSPAKA